MMRPVLPCGGLGAVRGGQRGATLVVGLIMIVLITLIVVNAFSLSSSNLKAVGNMQIRDEAIAAASQAIEQVLGSNFTAAPAAQSIDVDVNKDDANDYTVAVAAPVCIRAVVAQSSEGCDVDHPELCTGSTWHTEWDLDSTVTDASTGAKVRVRQGVRVLLTQDEKIARCP